MLLLNVRNFSMSTYFFDRFGTYSFGMYNRYLTITIIWVASSIISKTSFFRNYFGEVGDAYFHPIVILLQVESTLLLPWNFVRLYYYTSLSVFYVKVVTGFIVCTVIIMVLFISASYNTTSLVRLQLSLQRKILIHSSYHPIIQVDHRQITIT